MPTALEGVSQITRLVKQGEGRIRVMVCGKVRGDNVAGIAARTGASEFHASLRKPMKSSIRVSQAPLALGENGVEDLVLYATAAEDVRALRDALNPSTR